MQSGAPLLSSPNSTAAPFHRGCGALLSTSATILESRRTVYEITDESRAALRRWLDEPGAGPRRGTLLLERAELLARWAAWAEQEVRGWGGGPCGRDD